MNHKKNQTTSYLLRTTKSGFTLIEAIVVMAVIAAISTLGIMRLNAFQKDVALDSTTNEFQSAIRNMQNKSESGEVPEGYSLGDFEETFLPKYGLHKISKVEDCGNGRKNEFYETYLIYGLTGATSFGTAIPIKEYKLNCGLTVSSFDANFDRLTGKSNSFYVDIELPDLVPMTLTFTPEGYITIKEKI